MCPVDLQGVFLTGTPLKVLSVRIYIPADTEFLEGCQLKNTLYIYGFCLFSLPRLKVPIFQILPYLPYITVICTAVLL